MRFAYFPGCASKHSTTTEYDFSARALAVELGIDLVELEGANCCGMPLKPAGQDVWLPLAARDLALAERKNLDIVTICSSCLLTFSKANKEITENPALKDRVNQALGRMGLEYNGGVKVRHLLEAIVNDLGVQTLAARMKMPLRGLKVAPFYGCHLLRPPEKIPFTELEHPHLLEDLIRALGAETVEYRERCCGGPLYLLDEKTSVVLAGDCLMGMKSAGANCIVTACPLCHFMLDAQQSKVEKLRSTKIEIPVLHFTQFIGLALGVDPKKLKMSQNLVSTKKLVDTFSYIGVYYSP